MTYRSLIPAAIPMIYVSHVQCPKSSLNAFSALPVWLQSEQRRRLRMHPAIVAVVKDALSSTEYGWLANGKY